MGRRRRRVIRIVKKKLPTVFICPRCGEEAVRVTIAKDTGHATVLCALCSLKDEFPAHPAAQAIDVYSYFTDRFYGVKEPRAIIPRERAFTEAPRDELAAEEDTAKPEPLAKEVEESQTVSEPTAALMEEKESGSVSSNLEAQESASGGEGLEEDKTQPEESQGPEMGEEKESEEESEPFADILTNKDKKRYSSQPLPAQSSDQTS